MLFYRTSQEAWLWDLLFLRSYGVCRACVVLGLHVFCFPIDLFVLLSCVSTSSFVFFLFSGEFESTLAGGVGCGCSTSEQAVLFCHEV